LLAEATGKKRREYEVGVEINENKIQTSRKVKSNKFVGFGTLKKCTRKNARL
jgi:hypothetical protein